MHHLYEFILRRSSGVIGRLAAGALIGAIVGVLAVLNDASLAKTTSAPSVAIAGGSIGILAVLILELLDRDRGKPAALGADPDAPPMRGAADKAMGCATIVGIAIGCFSTLCAVVMGIVGIVHAIRTR